MAGPGGGPPRKSHTKSRKGCKTCKRRHIRCDETFPQCRNCTKHNCRCDYMDMPPASEEPSLSPRPPNLQTTPEIEREIDTWRMTGEPPFPELRSSSRVYWQCFSAADLRLIHHIAGLSNDIHRRGYSRCTVWAQKMPIFLAIALSNEFVMSAILALSASHLAWKTNDGDTDHLAYHHRGVALKGLHEAIGAFSRDNSEAILAASMLLSWQATEWRGWASLQQGMSTVMNAMRAWIHESELASYLEGWRSFSGARTLGTATFTSAESHPGTEDLARLDRAMVSLLDLRSRLLDNDELSGRMSELLEYLEELRGDFPLQEPEQAFERLQKLRSWLFWLPATMLRAGESDLGALAVLSRFFAVGLILEPLFPEIGGAYLGSMSVIPIEEMQRILSARRTSHPHETAVQIALSLVEEPVLILSGYKARQQYPAQNMRLYRPSPCTGPFSRPSLRPTSSPRMPPQRIYPSSPVPSPANLVVLNSPYHTPSLGSAASGRGCHYFDPVHASQTPTMSGGSMSYGINPGGSPGVYSPRYMPQSEMALGMEYQETSAFQPCGANTEFVSPQELWV